MQKLQDSVFNIIKTTNLSPAVFSFLQPTDDFTDKTPLGGILSDTKHGWLALGPKFCVIDLRSGLKIAARVFGNGLSCCTSVTSVVELPTPLTSNSHQLVISLECDNVTGMICVFHINGSQLLHCIQTDVVVSELAVCDDIPSSPFMCFDGLIMAGTKRGEVLVFDLNRTCLIDALKNISQGHEDEVLNEANAANLVFLPLKALHKIEGQRDLAIDNNDHLAVLLNEDSFIDGQYVFRNPDGSIRMKAKRDHIKVTVVQYIPQLASLAVGYNFGAFQIWNLLDLKLEFTSQVNVECLPVTHFGFQEPCDDPRAFCYLWVVFSVIDRFEEEEFPLAVMYSLTYQGKRMMSEDTCLYQEFSTATIRFQVELGAPEGSGACVGGRCISCRTYSVNSALADDGDDSLYTNICQLAWECWGERAGAGAYHSALLFDLDQWYKEQMPATSQLESNAFMAVSWVAELSRGECLTLDVRLDPASAAPYSHATRLEEHFYPNSLQYNCICLNTSEALVLHTAGVQRQLIGALAAAGPACLLAPARLRAACAAAGLAPPHRHASPPDDDPEEQRRCLLTVALEARLPNFLKRCAHDWATGTHSGVGCTLTFLVDWCWKRAIELKENAKELTAPLFTSSTVPDRNVIRCLEHCVQQLTQLTGLLDAILTKCCNLVVPDALSEMEEKFKGIGTVSLYFQVVQWFLRVGLLPERQDACAALPYPAHQLYTIYKKRRLKLQRLEDKSPSDDENESCSLLYIDQLIEHEFGGDRTHQMWMRGGSENGGLYPPPSLYALLRLYLLPDIAEEHKHSLVLYLLVDYSMVYDEIRYEEVIRRLMQFPTMFGLSNTAIKATQAFWHLDHRDFDFALDQLQCLTGNTLSEWQHNVVLSSLLAQKKTQAALQYLHVRKPAPVQNLRDKDTDYNRMSDHDKLEDWQPCCNLYLARGLVYEALDVIRMCVQNAGSLEDKLQVLNFFFKGCRNTGQLAKILNVTLLPSEEEAFIQYLQGCNEPQTSDILIMYYLQQARYLEAEQYNNKIKSKGRAKDFCTSAESLLDVMDREGARDMLVEVVCSAVPSIANSVARCAQVEFEPHIIAPKPMSVFVQARSPKNTFTYKSSFIQDTIENASETWVNKPQMRRGIKRALNVEDTPFICTPKLFRTKSLFQDQQGNSTPPKRAKLDFSGTPKTPKMPQTPRVSDKLSKQMATLLDMPEIQSPGYKPYNTRSGAGTPQSILKTRRLEGGERDAPSPADSRYLPDSDDELLETCSNHTHYSDSKHLRFTIPTASEGSSTPSPAHPVAAPAHLYRSGGERDSDNGDTPEMEPPSVSPPKKLAVEEIKAKKLYKDTVKARRSLSISANSSLSDNPNSSIESIADIPMTLINPKYTGQRRVRRQTPTEMEDADRTGESEREEAMDSSMEYTLLAPKVPQGRKSIRNVMDTASFVNRSRSHTPERLDSPVATPLRVGRVTRSRSRTPEVSPRLSPLAPIPELPKQESNSEPHPTATLLSVPRPMRSRSRTPERVDTVVAESRLQPITESPGNTDAPARPSARRALRQRSKTPPRLEEVSEETKMEVIPESPVTSNTESPLSSPTRRSLRSRSRTPELEEPQPITSPRILRSRSKTPEKLMSPKKDTTKSRKSLSRMVLEANAFAKTKQNVEKTDNPETVIESTESADDKTGSAIECTPLKTSKEPHKLMDVTFSPIVNKSILQSSSESVFSGPTEKHKIDDESVTRLEPLPAFTTISESYVEKSVLHSYQSSIAETSSIRMEEENIIIETNITGSKTDYKSLPAFNTINETDFGKSVLKSFQSSIAESSMDCSKFEQVKEIPKTFADLKSLNESELAKSVLRSEESSVAITSDDSFAKGHREETGVMTQNMSSLITDDSDVEMKDWGSRLYSQETAKSIQKEKQKIVEIEREINEMEDDMSDDCQVEHDTDSEDDDVEEEESEDDSQEEEEGTESDSEEEIISIADSDESSSSVKDKMHGLEEIQSEERNINAIQSVEVETEKENEGISEEIEVSTDPLNQAQVSMLTDDNSVEELPVNLNYSDETKPVQEEDSKNSEMQNIEMPTALKDVQIEVVVETVEHATEDIKDSSEEPKNTDDVDTAISKQQPEYSSKSHESEKIKNLENKNQTSEQKTVEEKSEKYPEVDIRKKFEVKVDKNIDEKETVEQKVKETTPEKKVIEKPVERDTKEKSAKNLEVVKEKAAEKEIKEKSVETSTVEKSVENQDVKEKAPETEVNEKSEKNELKEQPIEKELKKKPIQIEEPMKAYSETPQPKSSRRKRISSASSVKSSEDIEDTDQVTDEPKTPGIRKRAQSTASNKSVTEDSTPQVKTPRGKSKTPPREVRTILTRRVSRELGLEDLETNLDQIVTPRRRTTRSSSKNLDDSLTLEKSKGRESVEPEMKPTSARKGKKKTDLSVIPEVTAEESELKDSDSVKGGSRITRQQRSVLPAVPERAPPSEDSLEGDDVRAPAFDVQPIDRITLLNKTDFDGPPDEDEARRNDSPVSFLSESRPRNRLARAASESKTTPRASRVTRKASVDVVSELGESPASSPRLAGRRASFSRACEALLTPKGRRTSVDSKKGETDSQGASPAEAQATPARRSRRTSSARKQADSKRACSTTHPLPPMTTVTDFEQDSIRDWDGINYRGGENK